MDSRGFDYTALVLTIIGAINWGLIGLFKFDLVAFVFGDMTVMSVSYTHLTLPTNSRV